MVENHINDARFLFHSPILTMKNDLTKYYGPILLALFYVLMVFLLGTALYGIPITHRLIIADEINIGMPVQNYAYLFGISYENWGLPNFLFTLLNGIDGLIGILLHQVTDDWRTVKLIQYATALLCVISGFAYSLDQLLGDVRIANQKGLQTLKAVMTACYVFSPYAFMQMNNGTFWSFAVFFSIAFVPTLLVVLLKTIIWCDSDEWRRRGIGFGLLVGVCSWWLPLIMVVVFSTGFVWLRFFFSSEKMPKNEIQVRIIPLVVGLTLGLLPVLIGSYYILGDTGIDANFGFVSNATYNNIQGGLLTPFLQKFSWILYTDWAPKALHSYFKDFDGLGLRILYLAFIGVLTYALLKNTRNTHYQGLLVGFLVVYLSAIFFSKGGSFPFGFVFASLINYVPGFNVVRTPDTKFGLVATASFFLCCVTAGTINKFVRRAVVVLGFAYLFVAIPLWWSGELINPTGPARYMASLTPDEVNAINHLNNNADDGRVLILPGTGGGVISQDGYSYVGREYLVPSINRSVVSLQDGVVAGKSSVMAAREFLENMDFLSLREMGIRYILVRKAKDFVHYHALKARSDQASLRLLIDGDRIALFALIGSIKSIEVVDNHGDVLLSQLQQIPFLPLGFLIDIDTQKPTQMPWHIRADVVPSKYWALLPLDENDNIVMSIVRAGYSSMANANKNLLIEPKTSRVGLAEWVIAENTTGNIYRPNKRWLIINFPSLFLVMAMASCLLLAVVLLMKWAICKSTEYVMRRHFSHKQLEG